MEEQVGQLWHRFITRAAATHYPAATVELTAMSRTVGILFRASGGDARLRIEATTATIHGARRSWLQRLAGSHQQIELGWRDTEALRLPAQINWFAERQLNYDLYLWLAVLAAGPTDLNLSWFLLNQRLTQDRLIRFPGLQSRYERLVAAQLALRPDLHHLPAAEAAQEQALQQALRQPGSVTKFPPAKRPHQPVYLWLHPSPPMVSTSANPTILPEVTPTTQPRNHNTQKIKRRRRGEYTQMPDGNKGLLAFRLESLFTLAEYVKVDRCTDEEKDTQAAKQALDDMEQVSVARDNQTAAATLRFDLDLPAPAHDHMPIGEGISLPEWDYKRQQFRPAYCCLQPMLAATAPPVDLPPHLKLIARRLRNQFATLIPTRTWYKNQPEGSEIDLDAYLLQTTEYRQGKMNPERGLYRDFRQGTRDLACLLLADLSLSTEAWINNTARIIDIIRDSLFLFAEALTASGDKFALYGFSSRHRNHIRFHILKEFTQTYDAHIRGRIQAIKPDFYTRMGAAIRHASNLLRHQPASQHLLLFLTDGKPNDLDQYEGRYGIEDTRMALHEARKQGLQPFCVTIDETANDYLPHLFGNQSYVVIRKPSDLPRELPLLYARLTQAK
jgi:nitric oxide reductase NorD protein